MADFSPTATQLAAPQGAGSAPVAPVQEQAVNESAISVLASAAPTIGRGIAEMVKTESNGKTAADLWITKQSELNSLMAKEPSKAGEIAVRSRALYQEMVGLASLQGGTKGVTALANARKEFIAGTEMGVMDEAVKTSADLRKDEIKAANAAGFDIDPAGPKQVVDTQVKEFRQYKAMVTKLELMGKQMDVEKKQTDIDKEKKSRVIHQEISDYASSVINTRFALAQEYRAKIDAGGDPVALTAQYNQHLLRDDQLLTTLSSMNKGAADDFRTLIKSAHEMGSDFLSGKKRADVFKSEADAFVSKADLRGMQDPQLARRAAAMQRFPNVVLSNSSIAPVMDWVDGREARVVGTPAEKGVNQTTASILKDVANGNTELLPHANNVVNGYFRDIGNRISVNDPKTLEEAAAFLANPVTGQFLASPGAKINEEHYGDLRRIMDSAYEKPVQKTITNIVNTALTQPEALPAAGALKRSITDPNSPALAAPRIDTSNLTVKFNGGGITWDLKELPADPAARRDQLETLKELRKSERSINQLIHMNSHVRKSTDYAKDWEENKHRYLPLVYAAPLELSPDGKFEYVGKGEPFDRNNKSSWRAIKQAE